VIIPNFNRTIILLPLFCIFSCVNKQVIKQNTLSLPTNELVNEILMSIDKIDKLKNNYSIANELMKPTLYNFGSIPIDSISLSHISFDELSLCFNIVSDEQRKQDSLFVLKQFEVMDKYFISEATKDHFAKRSKEYYQFEVPIFNSDKTMAELKYYTFRNDTCILFRQQILIRKTFMWRERKIKMPKGPFLIM